MSSILMVYFDSTIQRPWASYNPIQGATSATLACNDDGTSLSSGQLTATVSAGTAIKANWNQGLCSSSMSG
jgi:cellulase